MSVGDVTGRLRVAVGALHQSVASPVQSTAGEPKLLVTVTEAASLLSVNRSTVYDMLDAVTCPRSVSAGVDSSHGSR